MTQGFRFALGGAVATAVLFQASLILGPVGAVLNLLTPFPAAYAQMRSGLQAGLLALVLACGAILALGGPDAATTFALQYAVVAALLPWLLRRGESWGKAAAITTLVVGLVGLPALGALSLVQGDSIQASVASEVDANVEEALAVYREQGLTETQLEELERAIQQMVAFMTRAYYGLSTLWVGLSTLLMVAMLRKAGERHYQIEGPDFWQIRLPEALIWPLIAAGFGMLAPVEELKVLCLNLLTLLLPLYFLQGMAVVSAWFRRRRVSSVFRVLGYTAILILNPMPLVITGVGIFDLWLDFRKFTKK